MILMSDPPNYPMQSYLRTVVVNLDMRQPGGIDPRILVFVSDRALRAAHVLVATVPLLIVYLFLQQYFITGIKLGALPPVSRMGTCVSKVFELFVHTAAARRASLVGRNQNLKFT